MGRATIMVAPEILPQFVLMLPSTTRIVGSCDSEPYVKLVLEADGLADGVSVTGQVTIEGLRRTFEIVPNA